MKIESLAYRRLPLMPDFENHFHPVSNRLGVSVTRRRGELVPVEFAVMVGIGKTRSLVYLPGYPDNVFNSNAYKTPQIGFARLCRKAQALKYGGRIKIWDNDKEKWVLWKHYAKGHDLQRKIEAAKHYGHKYQVLEA